MRAQDTTVEGPLPAPHAYGPGAQSTGDSPQLIEGPQAVAPRPAIMNNDSVPKMARAGLGDDLILQTIDTQPGQYLTDPDSLVLLKQAGLTDRIIAAMMSPRRRQLTPEKPIVLLDVNEIGVYYKDRSGRWTAIEPATVHLRSGGFIKSTVTNGIIKQDRNGRLNGRESALPLPRPIELLIYTADGVAANEYDLLRFRINSSNREFRTYTGGVFHSTSGADRDEVPFKPVKTAPHSDQFTVDQRTPGGEYGILAARHRQHYQRRQDLYLRPSASSGLESRPEPLAIRPEVGP